ncbi:MAG: D-alanyl-D-alanine carboxypeptidase [Firmicutes bacterium]|jgi:D-alanyl-D-alanine carboxypeptidase (penicillin-binding protein 5/6)|nr:D-alanyl-D-alanine carboxypeptidase [Bacillota bacterium]HQD40418.1 D-alanyl-D-alanine carboxypeptidase family protein [Bacillota bacterium]
MRKRFAWLVVALLLAVSTVAAEAPFKVQAPSAVLMEASTGMILLSQGPDEKRPPASITKLMTMLLTMEAVAKGQVKLTDKITVSEYAASMGGSQIWLEPGEQLTLHDMLKAIAVVSANDASVAVAEHLSGSVEAFVKKMNQRARELGMKNSYFCNPNGLPPDEGRGCETTAMDVAILSRELLKHPKILEYTSIWMGNLDARPEPALVNTNKLVRFYEGCDGLKTGYTSESKYCLAATAKRDSVRLIAVVMGAESTTVRNAEITKLFNYGFSQLVSQRVAKKGQNMGKAKIEGGVVEEVALLAAEDLVAVQRRESGDRISLHLTVDKSIKAPIKKGQRLGWVTARSGDLELGKVALVAQQDVEKAGIFRLVGRFFRNLFRSFFGG